MKMIRTVCTGAALALLSGCIMFYNGSEEGLYSVEAERNEPGVAKDNRLLIKGAECHPSPAGRFLVGRPGTGW